jgi:hypothetical protein
MGERAAALEALEIAVSLEPSRPDAWNLLGQLFHSSGALTKAQDALKHAVSLRPEDVTVRRNLATALRASGRFDESLAEVMRAAADARSAGEDPSTDAAFVFAPTLLRASEGELAALGLPIGISISSRGSSGGGSSGGSELWTEGVSGAGDRNDEGTAVVAVASDDALPSSVPPPWRPTLQKVWLTRVASDAECEWVVLMAEAHAEARGGWNADGHHTAHPTNDIVVSESEPLARWVRSKLLTRVWPALEEQFGMVESDLWLEDCFVVKYEADGQPGLSAHRDDSELSFNLLLSDPGSFEGGGTQIVDADATIVRPARGEMLSHYGRVTHAGVPTVGGGARYILAGFVRAKPLAAAWEELRPEGS